MKIVNYYASMNTAIGFADYFKSNLQKLSKVYILKGGPGTGKSTLMKKVGEYFQNEGYDVELIHCSSDNNSLDGVIIPALSVGIVDGTAPHVIEPDAVGAIEEYVNIGAAINSNMLEKSANDILRINQEISDCYKNTYKILATALKIHDGWEKFYISNLDYKKANELADKVIQKLLGNEKKDKESVVKHRFFGGCTYEGPVDFVENITEPLKKRYFIKGRPGSGKSTVLKKLIKQASQNGLDVEVYHCGLDPNSLDMVVLRELDLCIFDSTAPHEYFPTRDNDEIIDFYSELIVSGTDEKYADELNEITTKYTKTLERAISYLIKAKNLHDDLEKIYVPSVNFKIIDQIQQDLIDKIEARAIIL